MYSYVNLYEDTLTDVLCSKKAAGWYLNKSKISVQGISQFLKGWGDNLVFF